MNQKPAVDFTGATIEDLMANPAKYGVPSFEDYCKNRGKWNPGGREDESMIVLTDGPQKFRRDLQKIKLQIHGNEMPPEHIERALSDYGYTLADIDLENRNSRLKKDIQMHPQGGGKYDVVVNFLP